MRRLGTVTRFYQGLRTGLPRATHRIYAELVRVARPNWSRLENSAAATRRGMPTKLMIDWCHGILRDTPRIILLHHHCRRHNQCGRLASAKIVIFSMPRFLHRLILSPIIALRRHREPTKSIADPFCVRVADSVPGSEQSTAVPVLGFGQGTE